MKTLLLTATAALSTMLLAEAHHHHEHDHHVEAPACEGHDHHHEHDKPVHAKDEHTNCDGHDHDYEAKPHTETTAPACDGHSHDHAAGTGTVTVAVATQKLIGLKTMHAEKRQIFSTVTLRGRFEINPDAQTSVTTPIAGRLSLKRKTLEPVVAGEPLFTITSPDLLTRSTEIQALRQRLANYRTANIANAEIEMQLKIKESEWAALVGTAEVVNGTLTIVAPVSGVIEQRFTNDGAWVELGEPIVQLRPQNALRYKAFLTPAIAKRLTNGMHVHYGAHHASIRLGLTAESGLTPVYLYFEHPLESECDGAYAEIDVTLKGDETPVVAVPKRALVQIGVQPTLFVRDPHDATQFVAYPVTLGESANGWVAVEGLPHGTPDVVIAGQYELKLALPSAKPKEAGHYHADGTFHAGEH